MRSVSSMRSNASRSANPPCGAILGSVFRICSRHSRCRAGSATNRSSRFSEPWQACRGWPWTPEAPPSRSLAPKSAGRVLGSATNSGWTVRRQIPPQHALELGGAEGGHRLGVLVADRSSLRPAAMLVIVEIAATSQAEEAGEDHLGHRRHADGVGAEDAEGADLGRGLEGGAGVPGVDALGQRDALGRGGGAERARGSPGRRRRSWRRSGASLGSPISGLRPEKLMWSAISIRSPGGMSGRKRAGGVGQDQPRRRRARCSISSGRRIAAASPVS